MYAKYGTFIGTGADQQVDVGFAPDAVLIFAVATGGTVYAHGKEMPNETYITFVGQGGHATPAAKELQDVNDTGFLCRLILNTTYTYFALKAGPTKDLGTITWTGNAADNRNLTGLGFQPDLIIAASNVAENTRLWHKDDPQGPDHANSLVETASATSNAIQSVSTDGFQVGTLLNSNNSKYAAICFKEGDNLEVGTFVGDDTGDKTISIATVSSLIFIFSALLATNGSNFNSRGPFRGITNNNGFGHQVGSVGETSQSFKGFSGANVTLDTFINNSGFRLLYFAFGPQDPPAENLPTVDLPPLPGGGAGGILPFAGYQRYKMLRAMGQQLNNLVLGP